MDLHAFRPTPSRAPSPADTSFRVVTIGRLVPQKGQDTLVRAVAAARATGVDVTLRLVGEGPLDGALRALVRAEGLDEVVELVPPVADVRPLLAAADLFALPSRWEGQSNALLEAMACGLAVLVSDLEVLHEVVGRGGTFAAVDDVAAWAAALVDLAADAQARQTLGDAARRRVEDAFDAGPRSAELVELYRSLVARRTG